MYLLWNINDLNTSTSSNTLGIAYLYLWSNVLEILPTSQIHSRSNYYLELYGYLFGAFCKLFF